MFEVKDRAAKISHGTIFKLGANFRCFQHFFSKSRRFKWRGDRPSPKSATRQPSRSRLLSSSYARSRIKLGRLGTSLALYSTSAKKSLMSCYVMLVSCGLLDRPEWDNMVTETNQLGCIDTYISITTFSPCSLFQQLNHGDLIPLPQMLAILH